MSSINPYFKNFNSERHQYLVESKILESVKKFGYIVKYIPRKIVNMDHLFGEDTLSKFENAIDVEVYIKNIDSFAGQGRFLSKFGTIELRDQITFSISKLRYDQIRTPKILTENGYVIQDESREKYKPNSNVSIMNEETLYEISERPLEGDLIWFPLVNKMFEIKYVNAETVFYQFGQLLFYDMECEMFEYSSEKINTQFTSIDNIETFLSSDENNNTILTENNENITNEQGSRISDEINIIENVDKFANNNLFKEKAEDVVDFSAKNPFVIGNERFKW